VPHCVRSLRKRKGEVLGEVGKTYQEFPTDLLPFSSARRRHCAALNCTAASELSASCHDVLYA
jgi:hypothetical protein